MFAEANMLQKLLDKFAEGIGEKKTRRRASTADQSDGCVVSTLAGAAVAGSQDGSGTSARFWYPHGVALDSKGNLFVCDEKNHTIRQIDSEGHVTTYAGVPGKAGYRDGKLSDAEFNCPAALAFNSSGALFVSDSRNHLIRKIENNMVSTFAGSRIGFQDGHRLEARFDSPLGIAVDSAGDVIVADSMNHRIRKILMDGVITLSGNGKALHKDGDVFIASFSSPTGVAIEGDDIYIADFGNQRIRKILHKKAQVVTVCGSGKIGFENGPGLSASFSAPYSLAVAAGGRLFIADRNNHAIRQFLPEAGGGTVSTVAGSGAPGYSDSRRLFNCPRGIVCTANGALLVSDQGNHAIRRVIPPAELGNMDLTPAAQKRRRGSGGVFKCEYLDCVEFASVNCASCDANLCAIHDKLEHVDDELNANRGHKRTALSTTVKPLALMSERAIAKSAPQEEQSATQMETKAQQTSTNGHSAAANETTSAVDSAPAATNASASASSATPSNAPSATPAAAIEESKRDPIVNGAPAASSS